MRTSTHMEVLFSCLLAITLGILIIVSLLQYKQQSKSLLKDIENRSPFQSRHCLNFLSPSARCGRPPQRGCQLPRQQPQPIPLSPLHFTIVTFLRIVLLSNIVGYLLLSLQLFQGLFFALITLQQMHLGKKINFVTKRSPTTLDPGVSNTSRRLVRTKEIRNIANIHTSHKRDFKRKEMILWL